MTTQGGYGVVLKIMVTTTLTAVAHLIDVDFPKFKKYLAESTGHDSTLGYYTATATGKRRLEPFPAVLEWDSAAPTHAAMQTAFDSDAAVSMSIQDPNGDEVIAFSAHIEEVERVGKQEETYKANVLIHPTGAPTIT